jgi:peptidoglycan/xylan/chitin deacetylase (PgdA/CDA1 family)
MVRDGRCFILTYHSIDTSDSVISIAPGTFREQMRFLAEHHVPVKPLEEVRSTPGAVAITFDDGFRNFAEHALPVLSSYGFPATVFAVSGYCGKRNNWPSQVSTGIPNLELMDWRELREAGASNVRIGAHTVNHPLLTRLTDREIQQELRQSRQEIEQHMGRDAPLFAYPYGNTDLRVCRMARQHFDIACTTELAAVRQESDALRLPRIDAYYLRSTFWFNTFRSIVGESYIGVCRLLRKVRTAEFTHVSRRSPCPSTLIPQ